MLGQVSSLLFTLSRANERLFRFSLRNWFSPVDQLVWMVKKERRLSVPGQAGTSAHLMTLLTVGTKWCFLCSHPCPEPFYSLPTRPSSAPHHDPVTQEAFPPRFRDPWKSLVIHTIAPALSQGHCPVAGSLSTPQPHPWGPSLSHRSMRIPESHRKQRTEGHGAMGNQQRSYMIWVATLGCGSRLRGGRWRVGGGRPSPHNIL